MIEAVRDDDSIRRVEILAATIWHEHYPPIIGKPQVEYMLDKFQSFETIREQIQQGRNYLLIVRDGVDAGYAAIDVRDEGVFISKLYILRRFRGMGLAKKCYLDICTAYSGRSISLTVNKNNDGAIKFYEKMGLRKVKEVVTDIGGGFVMDDYVMELQR